MERTEFRFHTKLEQTLLLGIRAKNAAELLEGVAGVPESSIYYHTHHFLQQHHYLSPEPTNDFAYWVTEMVNDAVLGEALSSIDIMQFQNLAGLREKILEILTLHAEREERSVDCPRGSEFHFMASQTFSMNTPHAAHDLAGFADCLRQVSVSSLYYHIFDARLRLPGGENDFSVWFRTLGQPVLAQEVLRMDPYRHTLEGLRKRILVLVKKYDQD